MITRIFFKTLICLPIVAFSVHTIVRIIRHFHKFPMPEFMANLIDNPLRRKIQPPGEMPLRHMIEPGMLVLDVGPGNGRYTIETARRVGETGSVVAIDLEPRMIERVRSRAQENGITNLKAKVANVYDLPFEDDTFDAIYMITVIGEIPNPERALGEFYRVLKPSGTIAFSEILTDPDYPSKHSLIRKVLKANFRFKVSIGSFFAYTLVFEK